VEWSQTNCPYFPATFLASGAIFVIAPTIPAGTKILVSGKRARTAEKYGTVHGAHSFTNLETADYLKKFPEVSTCRTVTTKPEKEIKMFTL